MSAGAAPAPTQHAVPGWLPWLFFGLLVLPMHPLWADFEQVRRGLLLLLAGACLIGLPRLPRLAGEGAWLAFVGFLIASAVINLAGQWIARTPDQPLSFQWWDAAYRLQHWFALLVVLRVGAATATTAALPLALLLIVSSAYGLLQRLGLAEWQGYGVEREPVSLFGNLNVAAEWTAAAATAVAVMLPRLLAPRARLLAQVAIGLAAAYLVVDRSRSGLVALPLVLLLLGLLTRRREAFVPLLLALAGGFAGLAVNLAAPLPPPADPVAATAERQRGTATLQVRFEIAKGSWHLCAESPLFGHGPGQFAVQYPRVRSQDEIELSSDRRRFQSEVRTAHDDWLELVVDGGLPGLLLFAAALFALQRAQREKVLTLPLLAVLLMMLVRSPLTNAPAAVAALWFVGVPVTAAVAGRRRRIGQVLLGVVMIGFGVLPVLGNSLFVPYLAAAARGEPRPAGALAAAAAVMPFEPRWLSLLAQQELILADAANARFDRDAYARHVDDAARFAARAVQLRPFDPTLYQWLVEALAKANKFPAAFELANHALKLDPNNPDLRQALSATLAQQGRSDAAIAAVVVEPHPRLREALTRHFAGLTAAAKARRDDQGAARFAVEHHFLAAVDGLGDVNPAALDRTGSHVQQMVSSMREVGMRPDVRTLAVSALHYLDLGRHDDAIQLGDTAQKLTTPLVPWQRALFGDHLLRLDRYGSWPTVLSR